MDVITDLANEVNTPRNVQVVLTVQDSNGPTVLTPPPQNVQLSVQTLLTAVDFGQISTQGLANGTYTLAIIVKDPTSGHDTSSKSSEIRLRASARWSLPSG